MWREKVKTDGKAEERSWERIRGGIEGEGEQESRELLI